MDKARISVTDLAQLICRAGDLELGGVAGPTARDGQKAHQRWQEKTNDSTEVSVRATVAVEGVSVTIRGRIDLLDLQQQRITEIKSTLVPSTYLSDSQKALHRAQVRLYAFCWLNQEPDRSSPKVKNPGAPNIALGNSDSEAPVAQNQQTLPAITDAWHLDVLYVNIRNETSTRESESFSSDQVQAFGEDVVKKYILWMKQVAAQKAACRESAKTLPFPYPNFRAGQRELAATVYRGARDGFSSLIEAPTGIGKTVSALYPAMKAIGENDVTQVVYLTAKASGVKAVSESLERMVVQGLRVNSVSLRSKQLTCFCSNGTCERDDDGRCPMTMGFFDRLPSARDDLLSRGVITPAVMDEVALQYELCPFELALQMLPWMSVVVCDYNYVFDPLVRLPWFSESRRKSLVLIDEAHNLPDRSRSMFSAQLDRRMGRAAAVAVERSHRSLLPRVDAVDRALLKHGRGLEAGETVSKQSPNAMRTSVGAAIETLMESMSEGPALPIEAVDWFKALCRYAAIDDLYSESHQTITEVSQFRGKKEVCVRLVCLDASNELNKLYKYYKSLSFFSATMRPAGFYQATLGVPEKSKTLQLNSPFEPNQSEYIVVPTIGTRYRQRDESLHRLVELIRDVTSAKQGSYLVFLPSFVYLEKIFDAYQNSYPEQRIWKQHQGQSREEHQAHLDALLVSEAHLGFVILGGVFGEGVDYVGNRLIGAVVVGVGLPGLSAEQELMAEYYRELGFDGYDFANRIPGLIRVLQTMGRVIRTESDRGVVVLVDDRFQHQFYRSNFPDHIQPNICRNRDSWTKRLQNFWEITHESA